MLGDGFLKIRDQHCRSPVADFEKQQLNFGCPT